MASKLLENNGRDVTLNIGLGKGKGHCRLTVQHRLRVLTKLLPQIFEAGYVCHLHLTPNRVWFGEPLAIIQGTLKDSAMATELLYDGVVAMEQDCIAIYFHEDDSGTLYGPDSAEWGAFNVNFFYFLGDKHD